MGAAEEGGAGPVYSTRRRAVERLIGPDATETVARQWRRARRNKERRLSRLGRRTDALLAGYGNRHRGERCVIIGNGPSLNNTPMDLLAGVPSFGLNRIYLMYDRLGFTPTYHVVVNRLVVEQCYEDLLRVPSPLFTTWPNRDLLATRTDCALLQNDVDPGFYRDPRVGVWEGATVTYVAMQLAYFMGFAEVLLVGVDHSFASKGPAHQTVTSTGADPDHFDPNYFGKGFRWQLPDLETSEAAYALAGSVFDADGRRIIDCTVGGKLSVFPKADLAVALRSAPATGG